MATGHRRAGSLLALRHVLLGINAHINYDMPQAPLAVVNYDEFADPVVLGRRARDHERIDGMLSGRTQPKTTSSMQCRPGLWSTACCNR